MSAIVGEDALRGLLGGPSDLVRSKITDRLNDLLESCAVEGKVPKLAMRIEIDEAFTHCSKAFLRSNLWDPERYVDREELRSPGELMRSVNGNVDPETYDAERYSRREGFY